MKQFDRQFRLVPGYADEDDFVTEPLLFVCSRNPAAAGGQPATRLVSFPSPTGPVFMAFGSERLAAAIAVFHGIASNVFLAPETDLTPELVGSLTEGRVFVVTTARDYSAVTQDDPHFPWLDRVISYDFSAALARLARPARRHE